MTDEPNIKNDRVRWIPVKPEGAPYWGIHTDSGETVAGTSSGLSEGDARLICDAVNGELPTACDDLALELVEVTEERDHLRRVLAETGKKPDECDDCQRAPCICGFVESRHPAVQTAPTIWAPPGWGKTVDTPMPNIKNDDRLAGGGGEMLARQVDLLRGILASGECDWLTTDESNAIIFAVDCILGYAALRQRCEQAEAGCWECPCDQYKRRAEQAERERDEAVADARRYRTIRGAMTGGDAVAYQHFHDSPKPETAAEMDALCDAALAHDAQEGKE